MLDSEMSEIIRSLFDLRTDSDYDDFFVVSKEDVTEQVENAGRFLAQVRGFLQTKE